MELDITNITIELISGKLTCTAGLGRIDLAGLQQWLLHFGIDSQQLRCAVVFLARLM